MLTREECLKWAEDAEQTCRHPHSHEDFLEALCVKAWNEAIEASKKKCSSYQEITQSPERDVAGIIHSLINELKVEV